MITNQIQFSLTIDIISVNYKLATHPIIQVGFHFEKSLFVYFFLGNIEY